MEMKMVNSQNVESDLNTGFRVMAESILVMGWRGGLGDKMCLCIRKQGHSSLSHHGTGGAEAVFKVSQVKSQKLPSPGSTRELSFPTHCSTL